MVESFRNAVPVIGTADVAKTVSYFEHKLEFKQQWAWGDPPVYAGIKAGGALLYVSADPELATALRQEKLAPDVFVWVNDIDSVYARHCQNGVEIAEELSVRPWGVKQYVIREPNGYLLKIVEDADGHTASA
jgi:catechol 2,3-dioxygenase-like lactoylglutathione lyase family enzyme